MASSPSWRSRAVAGMVGVLIVVLLAVSAPAAGGVKPPRRPFVATNGLFARAKLGAYCVTYERDGRGVGVCTAAAAPDQPPKPRIRVEPGDRFTMLFRHRQGLHDRPTRLHASLGRIEDGDLETLSAHVKAHRVRGHPRKWRARAPSEAPEANVLELFETFPAGDASYFVGLRQA